MFGVPLIKLQHTYIIDGEEEEIEKLLAYLENEGVTTIGNPGVIVERHEQFGILESRAFKEKCSLISLGEHTFYILATNSLTHEAEQSLLKLLEEPIKGLHFFLVTPYADQLLDTLRSRAQIIPRITKKEKETYFLKKSIVSRLGELRILLKAKETDEESVSLTSKKALALVESMEQELAHEMSAKKSYHLAPYLNELLLLKRYLHTRGASTKMILEHLALTLPEL
jgi:hypothetical protein